MEYAADIARLPLAGLRLRVFPVVANGKEPERGFRWKEDASADAVQVQAWADGFYRDSNYGVNAGASGLVVIDIDDKAGKEGSRTWERLTAGMDIPETLTVSTPSGGRHLYFRGSAIRNSAGRLGPGVDVRGEGGYVVGPGSVIDGRRYEVTGSAGIAALPDGLGALLTKSAERAANAGRPIVELDTSRNVREAGDYLRGVEAAIQGAGGDDHTFRVACRVLDFGLTVDAALELMLTDWNERCAPPWQAEELRRKLDNAAAYRSGPIGSASLDVAFADAESWPADIWPEGQGAGRAASGARRRTGTDLSGIRLLPAGAFRAHQQAEHAKPAIVKGYLRAGSVFSIIGSSGIGKSTVAVHVAHCLSEALPLWGDRAEWAVTDSWPVVYIAGEDEFGIGEKLVAAGATRVLVFMNSGGKFSFRNIKAALGDLHEVVRRIRLETGKPPVIIVDTLRSVIGARNIIDDGAMNELMQETEKFCQETGATVGFCHHTNRSDPSQSKGFNTEATSALEILVEELAEGGPERVIKVGKNRIGKGRLRAGIGRIEGQVLDGETIGIFVPDGIPADAFDGFDNPAERAVLEFVSLHASDKGSLKTARRASKATKGESLGYAMVDAGTTLASAGGRRTGRERLSQSLDEAAERLQASGHLEIRSVRIAGRQNPRQCWFLTDKARQEADGFPAAMAEDTQDPAGVWPGKEEGGMTRIG